MQWERKAQVKQSFYREVRKYNRPIKWFVERVCANAKRAVMRVNAKAQVQEWKT